MNYDYWLDKQLYLHDMEAERNERMQEELKEQQSEFDESEISQC